MLEPTNVTYDICRCYMRDYQSSVDPTIFRTVDGYHRSRHLVGLATCSLHFDPTKHTIRDWRFTRQIEAFFKKNSLFAQKDVCFEAAKKAFETSERKCSETNVRLKKYIQHPALLEPDMYDYFSKMTRYIRNVLGDFQSFTHALPGLVKVTSGATAQRSRRNSLPQLKMSLKTFCTKSCEPLVRAMYSFFGFHQIKCNFVSSNRVELVPKNWKTDRTIACEPEGNLPFQLAFDTYTKRRLRRFGINLRNQSANIDAARAASVDGDRVTVDFSAASDTISYNTVALLMPYDWFNFLDRIRTPLYRGVFGDGVYSKFSSMGNGSTFTIETLIFAAACYAVGSRDFLVYGDDVIIEKEYYEEYIRLTKFLGFSINKEKSFSSGPFRESCGGDFFNGINVTPKFIRSIDKRKASLCHLINSMATLALPDGHLVKYLADIIVRERLPYVPYSESSQSGIWIDIRSARSLKLLYTKHCKDYFKSYVPKTSRRKFVDSRGYYLWFLRKNSQVLFSGPWEIATRSSTILSTDVCETSSVPVFEHAYVRKRVSWFTPAKAIPGHLHWWLENLTRLIG